ncbi:MAG TPA: hypothetical protein ENK48_01760 [Gammaproteobacteria bacterium]|nr:hypothetical protein [Gammaproteobacteria bacterium]
MDKPDIQDKLRMNPNELYREEIFTDRRAGTLRRLTPVTPEGSDDPSRGVLYVGNTQILTALGTLPITFEIEAASLGEAAEKFAACAERAVEETMKELEELRREAASRIVVPESGAGGIGPGGMPPGGMGGIPGGGIQMP